MTASLAAVDLFCGAGGLTQGLVREGIPVLAGIDLDPAARYPFEFNNGASFVEMDIEDLGGREVRDFYPPGVIRIMVGCAPCTPFSPFTQGRDAKGCPEWGLLDSFARITEIVRPGVLSMENVVQLRRHAVFRQFVRRLVRLGYHVTDYDVSCPDYGVPQRRIRLVLFGSLFGPVEMLPPTHAASRFVTVRDAIANLPSLAAGEAHPTDPLHRSSGLTKINLRRIRASRQGGTWRDWHSELMLSCHLHDSGSSYTPVYGRMSWNEPSPTITTQFYNYGSGRFGHPEQDRAISLREAAILQSFPQDYAFLAPGEETSLRAVGRLIGNAVPVRLGRVIARSMLIHLEEFGALRR